MSLSDSHSDSSDVDGNGEDFYGSDESEVEEVLPIDAEVSSDEDDLSEDANSDEEAAEEYLKEEAWGKKKSTYFSTDFVDEDRGRTYREDDRELAKAEEEDALAIQKKYLQNVHSSVFGTSVFTKKEHFDNEADNIAVPEWKSISKTEKRKIIKRKWPEFNDFMEDFRTKIREIKQLLFSSKSKDLSNKPTEYSQFQEVKKQLYLHYLMNLSFYMHLKAKGTETSHAVSKKVMIMKSLLSAFDDLGKKIAAKAKIAARELKKKEKRIAEQATAIQAKKNSSDQNDSNVGVNSVNDSTLENEADKRGASYKIMKNKGLMPYRKKELRNPRVRHRVKFRKAEIKRKGQVKKPRTEISRYGGELTGIHPNVTRSIKIK